MSSEHEYTITPEEDGDRSKIFRLYVADGDSDGISNTIKEAMLMELPVICTSIAGNQELENVEFLNDWSNINEIIENNNRERNWKGRQEILKTYSPDTCVKRLLEAIEKYV